MTTTNGIHSMKDMYSAVATHLVGLKEPCNSCNGLNQTEAIINGNTVDITSETTYQPCHVCGTLGWIPTRDLQNIITNIEYNFTLVLQHDMIGWMADITLNGEDKDCYNERPVYGDPVTAVYAALYRTITKPSRSPSKERSHGGHAHPLTNVPTPSCSY